MMSSETAKQQLAKEAQLHDHDPDYDGLHQGRAGTKLRHDNVIQLLDMHGGIPKTLVDFGCGTALLLQSIADADHELPERYVGIDFLEERRPHVEARAANLGIERVEFVVGENITAVPADLFHKPNVAVVAIGIMGYPGVQSLGAIKNFTTQLRASFRQGVVTVPRHMPERLGEAEMARYDTEDVAAFLGNQMFSYRPIHTDTLVFW